ncbi:MAG: hypothetical protein P4L96_19810 [Rhodoferax sp.]|nr:hypothetical protein [Rhodoferax sp.]
MHVRKPALSVGVGLLLAGCAIWAPSVQPGMSRAEVLSRLGTPTAVVALPTGERLQYSSQPAGQTATMVDLDASGHVLQARQVLTATDLARIQPGWSRADVLREFGPPALIDHVATWDGDVWTYRWQGDGGMFYWVYFDRAGRVGRTQQGMEFFNAPNRTRR